MLPAELRECFRDVAPPPTAKFEGFTSCDQPHEGETLLRFVSTDPKIDELGTDLNALEAYAVKAFPEQCRARVATHMGLTPAQLDRRGDIDVASGALSLSRWPTEPDARLVQCLAVTRQATVGTLEGLGEKPLPSGTLSTTPAPGAGSPTARSGSNLEEAEAAERRAICQRYGSHPQKPAYC